MIYREGAKDAKKRRKSNGLLRDLRASVVNLFGFPV
jgi:hypothetical protein